MVFEIHNDRTLKWIHILVGSRYILLLIGKIFQLCIYKYVVIDILK
jgi:hypothetical protein